jgi:MarR family transcriptional regulator for hemolysin
MTIEPPTLAGILDRMERSGWISRLPHPTDKRRKLVRLEPRIGPVWEQLAACSLRVRARAVQGLPPEQLTALREGLAAVQENLGVEGLE